eukprot:CAMPEP_0170586956 /NCGR_PEP_ID=MMETSP0224-20130122/10022_1 /TAXON_ID=285029 /ORGANISM="Togula jolla, Strain CCCM 725" /LENGTH=137 /DNA_ID=CAMNT_0010910539 /DNA_START=37 /DNA_END=451 /DNA_ORIENTATION=+
MPGRSNRPQSWAKASCAPCPVGARWAPGRSAASRVTPHDCPLEANVPSGNNDLRKPWVPFERYSVAWQANNPLANSTGWVPRGCCHHHLADVPADKALGEPLEEHDVATWPEDRHHGCADRRGKVDTVLLNAMQEAH